MALLRLPTSKRPASAMPKKTIVEPEAGTEFGTVGFSVNPPGSVMVTSRSSIKVAGISTPATSRTSLPASLDAPPGDLHSRPSVPHTHPLARRGSRRSYCSRNSKPAALRQEVHRKPSSCLSLQKQFVSSWLASLNRVGKIGEYSLAAPCLAPPLANPQFGRISH